MQSSGFPAAFGDRHVGMTVHTAPATLLFTLLVLFSCLHINEELRHREVKPFSQGYTARPGFLIHLSPLTSSLYLLIFT